ncbi:hypothetical protein Leryth_001283 [Lithospermum erythrorhizon]|nr:hypothetical protein Leryth_001283 [Lithospermum erythrorhizon]
MAYSTCVRYEFYDVCISVPLVNIWCLNWLHQVKYQDTLRRFNTRIVNGELDLNMDGLREKIVYLFKFAPDTQLNFTYNDEDNDVVALVDDEDLRDVVRQALNPLRITVTLSTAKSLNSAAHSSGSSTPSLPPLQGKLQNLNSNVSEILNSLPEPLREPLTKLSSDLAKKASTYGASNLVEITDSLSKLGLHYLNQLSELPSTIESKKSVEASKDSDGSKNLVATTEVTSGASVGKPTCKTKKVLPKSKSLFKSAGVIFEGVSQPFGMKGSRAASGSGNTFTSQPVHPIVPNAYEASKDKQEVKGTSDTAGVKYFGAPPVANNGSSGGMDYSRPWWLPSDVSRATSVEGWRNKKSASGLQYSSVPPTSPFPLTAMSFINDTAVPHGAPNEIPGRSYNYSHGFHRGIRCDGCGVYPITGPRFKSKVRDDYDLCSICFGEMGNDGDFTRIDHPVVYSHPLSYKGPYGHHGRVHSWTLPPKFKAHDADLTPLELDSRFILDVNILDGTIMPPSTSFTKIWRMRNNGTTVWPQGTRLVWIGGVRMATSPSIELKIAAAGVHADQELDVAVDFIAPVLHGRHISYWRMALPTGQIFGQRVWVLIEVDASLKKPIHTGGPGFNLNLPPASECVTAPEVDDPIPVPMMNQSLPKPNMSNAVVRPVYVPIPEPMMNQSLPETNMSNASVETVDVPIPEPAVDQNRSVPNISNAPVETIEPLVNGHVSKEEAKFPIDDSLLVGMAILASDEVDAGAQTEEEKLLKELAEMGFKHTALNKEILKINKYDMEQTIEDLCGGSEWDPILEELEEMGFYDRAMNKRLLRKNDGSIKRVVMDLIAGETE